MFRFLVLVIIFAQCSGCPAALLPAIGGVAGAVYGHVERGNLEARVSCLERWIDIGSQPVDCAVPTEEEYTNIITHTMSED